MKTKVFLIGGAPGAGKTTLGTALASKLGITSLSIDDLLTAAQAVTTPESHPGLHFMRGQPFQEYFTYSSVERLKADATLQHEAAWPIVKRVIRKHASWGFAIVIDGWHLRPSAVSQLREENIWSGWIVLSASVLDERERKNKDWLKGSPDPERMLENFLARSFWYNTLIKEQAAELQMNILVQNGEKSVEALCQMVLDTAE
ncbi:MAG TPA: AAA family ATPase [candidate division Zixibacteria bacterium]|nr:AAA family ATPase [candidate division Zixibacteria bacterium]